MNRCTDVAAQCMEQYIDTVKVLPPALKCKLLAVACNRGNVNSKILCCLLHPNVKTLDLSECSISDDSVHAIYKCTHLNKLDLIPGRNQNREIRTAGRSIHLLFALQILVWEHPTYWHAVSSVYGLHSLPSKYHIAAQTSV